MKARITFGAMLVIAAALAFFSKIKAGEADEQVKLITVQLEEAKRKLEQIEHRRVIRGDFAHTVLIWQKNPEKEEELKQMQDGLIKLVRASQYVKSAHIGTPAGTDREVVDNSYTFCLIVTFEDAAAQDQYQVEPAHQQFLENHKHLWDKVLIYDSINLLD